MNQDETIVMQPQGEQTQQAPANQQQAETKQSSNGIGKGKFAAATAAAAVVGGVAGGAGTAAVMNHLANNDGEIEEQETPVAEAHTAEVQEAAPAPTPTETPDVQEAPTEVEVAVAEGPDYTNHDNADPVVETQVADNDIVEAQPAVATEEAGSDVQVLGVYEHTTEEGITQIAAVLTNGTDNAVVADLDGDGRAELFAHDDNQNGQIEENEVYDISDQNVQMSDIQDHYLAQQQMEQQTEGMAYNTADDGMSDYDNNADLATI